MTLFVASLASTALLRGHPEERYVLTCPSLDRNGDGRIAIEELVKTVDAALAGCEHVAGGVADGADLRQ